MMPKYIIHDRESRNVFGARYNKKKSTVLLGGPKVFQEFMEFEILQRLKREPSDPSRCGSRIRFEISRVDSSVWEDAVQFWERMYTAVPTRSFRRLMA